MALSPIAKYVVAEFNKSEALNEDEKISVNPVVAEVASWYEKLRNVMDYREDEVILRAAIERILKRRLLLGGSGEGVAPPLVRELVWARYFPDSSVPESIVEKVASCINLYLSLRTEIVKNPKVNRAIVWEWIWQLMSAEIEDILSPSKDKELMSNFMFHVLKNKVVLEDEADRDAQVFIAIRRAFAKEDLALLRYDLFLQYFGRLNRDKLESVAKNFATGLAEINRQLNHKFKDRIYTYIKRQTPPFLILEDVLKRPDAKELVDDFNRLNLAIIGACNKRYEDIASKVRRAIIRSVIFILITKAVLALAVEGSYESIVYGRVVWPSIAFNTLIPPILMVFVGASIKVPDKKNSMKIVDKIQMILFDLVPNLSSPLILEPKSQRKEPFMEFLFALLWLLAIVLSFGSVIFILTQLRLNIVSQMVFIFFLAIVSFLSYRIYQIAHTYTIKDGKQKFTSILAEFFFLPIVHAGRSFTVGISQINVFLFIFDFFIETPFKEMFSFFEQWFIYLRSQREKLD